jgi:hypothetical protein
METKFERVEAPAHPNAGGFTTKETHPVPQPAPAPAPTMQGGAAPVTDTVDVKLNNGMVVVLKDPGVACQPMVYRILDGYMPGRDSYPRGLVATVKALMYILSINGGPVIRPFDHVQAQALMNKIGDAGMETVATAYVQTFVLGLDALPLSEG